MSDSLNPVSIIHTQCGGEAFKYTGDTSGGNVICVEHVVDYHPDYKPESSTPIMCKSCGCPVSPMGLHPA